MALDKMDEVNLNPKRTTGETLEDRMTANAYHNVFPSRYAEKDENGNPVETPSETFERVAKNVATAEAVYESEDVKVYPDDVKSDHPRRGELIEEVFDLEVKESDGELYVSAGSFSSEEWERLDEAEHDVYAVELTEEIAPKFSYDNVVERAPEPVVEKMEETAETFEWLMRNLSFMPNSPTLMNAGSELQQLSACFVDSPEDDISDIHQTSKEAAEVFQSGGGMGYAFSRLRPYGDTVGSSGGIASGPITFMRTFDQMCETIAQGGTRRGAQMGIMRITHPDIIEFIHSKRRDVSLACSLRLNDPDDFTHSDFAGALQEAREILEEYTDDEGRVPEMFRNAIEGHLSNFNISVGVTDDFMEAAIAGEDFTFINPRTEEPHIATEYTKEMYSRYGLGDEVEVGEPLELPADEILDRVVDGAYENGEPGVVFLDKINDDHSFPVESTPGGNSSEYEIIATNPCGEQPLMEYEACNLGHINLSTIVSEDPEYTGAFDGDFDTTERDWRVWKEQVTSGESNIGSDELTKYVEAFLDQAIDWNELDYRIEMGVRFLDNVVTMSDFPVDKIAENVRKNRKIGLGIMGLAQFYVQLGIPYGSDVGNEVAEVLMRGINQRSKVSSHHLAEERGSFENWEDSKYHDPGIHSSWFTRQTGESADDFDDGFEMRNHNTTTIAPTGTTSMVGNTSGGCEPIYNVAYFKNVSQDVQGDEMLVEFDDYFLRVLQDNGIDVDTMKEEAERRMQNNEFDGVESLDSVPEEIGELFVVASDLTGKEHAAVQCALQEHVDSAISKTCNFPNSASKEDVREVYEFAYQNGGKGVTVYRDGTRTKQVNTTRADNTEFAEDDAQQLAVEVAERADSDEEFAELLADELFDIDFELEDGVPWYENGHFAKKRERPDVLEGYTTRINTGYDKLYVTINFDESGRPFELFATMGDSGGLVSSFTEALSKSVSVALRSGVDPEELAGHLCGITAPKIAWDNGEQINSIPDAIGTAIKRYIDEQSMEEPTPEADDSPERGMVDGGSVSKAHNEHPEETQREKCPSCDSHSVITQEGCKECSEKLGGCGIWSKC